MGNLRGKGAKGSSFSKYLAASYAENTTAAYAADVTHFKRWGGRIPSTENQVARYVAAYAGTFAHATLARRLAGLHREHLARGLRSPVRSELVRKTMKGVSRVYLRKQRKAKPILKEHLAAMVRKMKGFRGARDRALMLVGFMGGFRSAELVALNVDDVEFARQGIVINVRRSKTDQEGVGRSVQIPKLRGALCAVRALRAWLDVAEIEQGALFRGINRHSSLSVKRLTREAVGGLLKAYVGRIGLDPHGFSSHSLRAGLVTSAAKAGAAAWQIRRTTGHKSDAVLAGYIRESGRFTNNVAKMIFAN